MKKITFIRTALIAVIMAFSSGTAAWAQTSPQTITTSTTWTCPANVYSVQVECWGGGGAGGSAKGSTSYRATGGGGAGGSYVKNTSISVTPGTSYTVTVGAASTSSASSAVNGNPSWFGSVGTVYAEGGAGGASVTATSAAIAGAGGVGSSLSSIGTTVYKGGDGYMSLTPASSSAGGGGSAGTSSNGNSSTSQTGGTAVAGGGAGASGPASGKDGNSGSIPGGGGSGAYAAASTVQRTGGSGAAGKVILTWSVSSTFTVTYNANGGTGTMTDASSPYTPSSTVTVLSNTFTRTGYTFANFNTVAGGSGTSYSPAGTFTIAANTTLYAQWTANNNTVTFDANGGTGSMSNQTIATAASANLTTNSYSKAGYTFAGWATTAGGAVAYANAASYTMGTGNVTLYAKWTANNNTITFDGNGSTSGSMSAQTIATDASANLTANGYSKTGYTFAGWATSAGGAVSYANSANYAMGAASVTLYAQWTIISTPTISTAGSLSAVSTTYGTASATPTSFSISGSALTADILIIPPAGFEVSQISGGATGYAATQTLTQSAGAVSSTTVYVRLKATATVAGSPYSGNVELTSNGATTVNVATASSTVSPYTLTVSGLSGVNKQYDGGTTATLSGSASLSATVNSDVISLDGTPSAAFATAAVADGKTVTITGLSISGTNSTSYSLTAPATTANITAAPLTITGITGTNKQYDGTTSETITGTAAYSGLVAGESATPVSGTAVATFATASVGTGKTVTVTGYTPYSANYTLTQPTLIADITKADQTISLSPTVSKTISDVDYTLAATSATSAINPLSYTSSTPSVATIDATTGLVHIVGAGSTVFTVSQVGSANYNAASDATQTLTVSAGPIVKWTFEGVTISGTSTKSPTLSSTAADQGLQTSGSVFSAVHASNSTWTSGTGNGSTVSVSVNTWAINDYYQFAASLTGYKNISISCDQTGSNTGPKDFKLQYSTDGSLFTDFGSSYALTNDSWSSSSSKSASTRSFDLSTVTALNGATTAYFRIVCASITAISGTFGSGGTSRIDNFAIFADPIPVNIPIVVSSAKIIASKGQLTVSGVSDYIIYNAQGVEVANVKAVNDYSSVALRPGVYFVKVAGKTQKVKVK